jgi:hypothetical protein
MEDPGHQHAGAALTGRDSGERQMPALLRLVRIENCLLGVATSMIGYRSARAGGRPSLNEVAIVAAWRWRWPLEMS